MVFLRGGHFAYRGRQVRVRSFYIDQHEVTNQQYCRFLNDGNAKHWNGDQEIARKNDAFVPNEGKECWPVYAVSWHDADAYARWSGKRLPTDAEWLWAAAGSEGRKYAWGDEPITPERANYGLNVGHPQPVGSYPEGRSPDGVCDLTGNVAEWCRDWFVPEHVPAADGPAGPEKGDRKIRRAGCFAMSAERQTNGELGTPSPDYRPKCIGFRCVRPARRVLVLLGENFAELEFAAYTAVLGWASHTTPEGDYVMPKTGAPGVPSIEVVVAGFGPEVHGMGSMTIRPHLLVKDLTEDQIDRFDAVAVPACVGSGRGRHTYQGWEDISSDQAAAILRRVHEGGGIISTMCAGQSALEKAGLPHPKAGPERPVAYDPALRTATSVGPAVAVEAACLLLKELVRDDEYRSFRRYNPWLFGGRDQFPPRMESLR
jgi:putative intracellular protease/amidase